MNIHEYQAKDLLAKYGVPVPAGFAAMSVDQAVEAANRLPQCSIVFLHIRIAHWQSQT